MQSVDLAELTRNGEVRNLSGHERGQAARLKFGIADLNGPVTILVPDDLYLLAPSFFQGMFAESVRKAGSREQFLELFHFKATTDVLRQIDKGIEDSLMRRGSILAA